ncbi:MAG: efflux RND transporter periplasmic adaptor subunit [Bacteroidales bacterium]
MFKPKICYLCVVILVLSACGTGKNEKTPAEMEVPVVSSNVATESSRNEITLSGNIEGNKTVRLGFMVAGKINYIAVNEGQTLSKGQLLSSLDPVSYEIAKEMADIQVNQVQDEYDRLKLMYDKNSLSESDFAKISFGLQQAKAQQKLHTKNLTDTKLFTPFTGVLLKKLTEVGEITGVGMPLFVVSDISRIKVNAFIPENELENIRIGQNADVRIPAIDKTFDGKITEVGSVADPASRAYSVKLEAGNPGLLIRPGMIAEIVIGGNTSEFLAVPVEAVMHDLDNQSFVYVIDTAAKKAFKRQVSLGVIRNGKIEVMSGLREHETIVTGGQQKLVDGSRVIIKN